MNKPRWFIRAVGMVLLLSSIEACHNSSQSDGTNSDTAQSCTEVQTELNNLWNQFVDANTMYNCTQDSDCTFGGCGMVVNQTAAGEIQSYNESPEVAQLESQTYALCGGEPMSLPACFDSGTPACVNNQCTAVYSGISGKALFEPQTEEAGGNEPHCAPAPVALANVQLNLLACDSTGQNCQVSESLETNSDGTFQFTQLTLGVYEIQPQNSPDPCSGYAQQINVPQTPVTGVQLTWVGCSLETKDPSQNRQ